MHPRLVIGIHSIQTSPFIGIGNPLMLKLMNVEGVCVCVCVCVRKSITTSIKGEYKQKYTKHDDNRYQKSPYL
jgi:hypothetical protein